MARRFAQRELLLERLCRRLRRPREEERRLRSRPRLFPVLRLSLLLRSLSEDGDRRRLELRRTDREPERERFLDDPAGAAPDFADAASILGGE
mmetsp:Transcript_44080/g.87464  ORF Transcript_44080/g.87464 Transcript_44080/m.87464 type:complete len:93 (-) Transcript_44080:845-1123(-)